MTSIENYDRVVDKFVKNPNYIQSNYWYAPRHPFRMLIVGPSGGGKSNILIKLVLDLLYYDEVYLFAKDTAEPKYQFLVEFFDGVREKILKKENKKRKKAGEDTLEIDQVERIFHLTGTLDDMPNIDELDVSKQRLFIFDDFIVERDQKKIEDVFIRGRKKNVSVIYLSHDFHKTPLLIRLQSNYVILLKQTDKRKVREIAQNIAGEIDSVKFIKIYNDIHKARNNFMFIDMGASELPLKYRKNFDGINPSYF